MADDTGWRPLRAPARKAETTLHASPFSRLAVTHAFSVAGDTLLTVALAGSLFFSISPNAAKGKVALYLALTMAPFAVVAPLLGPLLDRSRGGRRLMAIAVMAGRAFVCWLMARDLNGLALYPEAFVFLVLSKTYSITKSALVPAAVEQEDELVQANSKLSLISVAVGAAAGIPGGIILKALGAHWVLRLASVVLLAGTVAAFRIQRAPAVAPGEQPEDRAELRSTGIRLAASAMALLRGVVGFLTFLTAFGFRRGHAPSWWFGVVLVFSLAGTLAGAALAPRLRQSVKEERILLGTLMIVTVVGLLCAWGTNARLWAGVAALAVAFAASAGKLAFDSLVQRDAPDAARGRSFARFETRFQLVWVAGAFLPVVIPIPLRWGFLVIALVAGFAAVSYYAGQRRVASGRARLRGGPRPEPA